MIFIFHALHLVKDTLVRTLVNIYCRRASKDLADNARAVRKSEVNMNSRVVMDEEGVKFSPPAYLQRYADVCDVIRTDPRWAGQIKKVVDFGCAELSLFTFLKSLAGLREVLHVDYDEGLLETHQHKVRPLLYDHLIHRETPFNVTVLQGSVCDPATHLLGCDAVICIELLEHLPPGVLDRVPHNIFGFIRPRVAVFTTPNSEFNVLFSRLKDGGFRHWDHRFEWTRQQFEDWAANIVSRYPEYTYEMGGVALGPEGTEHLGHCSQMAVFYNASYTKTDEETASSCTHKKKTEPPSQDWHNEEYTEEVHADISEDAVNADFMRLRIEEGVQSKGADISDDRAAGRSAETDQFQWDNINWGENAKEYKLIVEHEYPFSVDHRTRDEKILAHIWSKVHLYSHHQQEHCDDDDGDADDDFHDQWKVPLQCMVSDTSGFEISEDDLIRVMTANNIVVKDGFMLYKNERSDSGDDDDVPNNDFAASNVHYNNETIQNEECWDAPDDDFAVWNTSKESTRETSQAKHETDFTADSLDEDLANMDNYEEVETVTDYEMMDSGSLCDQNVILCSSPTVETSMADDRSQSNSPLAQFYVPNREAGEEQKLTDSGYIKSQDSPQSPVCSDTFSNDLITPDKDYPDMQSTTSILECIPENLNCLTPQHQTTSKEPSRQSSESRRKSVGPGINADDEFEKEPAISRPKSLHACSTKIEYPIASNFGLDSPWDMKDSPGSNIPEIFSPLEDEGVQLRRRFDVAVRNLPEVRHNVPERLARPDFLDVRNFEVEGENGDMLNNNLDFEGNHFDGVDDNIEVHNEGEFLGDDGELLRQHWDRHNENHLINDADDNNGVHLQNENQEIVEQVLEYQEIIEENENEGYFRDYPHVDALFNQHLMYPRMSPIVIPDNHFMYLPKRSISSNFSDDLISNCDTTEDSESLDTDMLIDSITNTLKLNSSYNLSDEQFPCCSSQNQPLCFENTPYLFKNMHKISDLSKNNSKLDDLDAVKVNEALEQFKISNTELNDVESNDSLEDISNFKSLDDCLLKAIENDALSLENNIKTSCFYNRHLNPGLGIPNLNWKLNLSESDISKSSTFENVAGKSGILQNGLSSETESDQFEDVRSCTLDNYMKQVPDNIIAALSTDTEDSSSHASTTSAYESSVSDFSVTADSVFPAWLLDILNPITNALISVLPLDPPAPTGRRGGAAGAGDGVGVHSVTSDTTSGTFSMTATASNHVQMDSLEEQSSLTSVDLSSSHHQNHDSSSSSFSSFPSDITSSATLLSSAAAILNSTVPNFNRNIYLMSDVAAPVSNSTIANTTSNTSANDADIENESD